MRWKFCGVLLFFCLPGSLLFAGPKTGETFEINADLSGVSGSAGAASEGGFRLNGTFGAPWGSEKPVSASGWEVLPGLWGGGPALRSPAAELSLAFGDPARPAGLTIPPNALTSDFLVFTGTSPASRPLRVSAAVVAAANANLARTLTAHTKPLDDRLWEILVLGPDGQEYRGTLRTPATLTLPYTDDDNDGVVDGTRPPVHAARLSLWWLDETHSLWVKLPDAAVDRDRKTVSAPIRHFSVFTVMGAPSFYVGDSFAFPVPWRPSGPDAGAGAGQTGTAAGGITFSNLPSAAAIRIYTLSGDLVREIDHSNGLPQEAWDVRNADGEELATGTYIYVIESAGARKTGKLAVIR